MNCKNKKKQTTGHYVYSTFSPCPVFINNLMVCLRTRLRVGNLLLRRIHETGKYFSIYTVINIHDYREMVDAGAEGVITSLGFVSTLIGCLTPCADWPWQAIRRSRGSTGDDAVRTAEEGKFDTGRRSEIKRRELLTFFRNSSATMRALAFTDSFISLISLSISSMKWMTKSTSLCLYICSVWKLVIRKLISYPCSANK